MKIIVLLDVFLFDVLEMDQLNFEAINLGLVLDDFALALLELECLLIELSHLLVELVVHALVLGCLDLDELLLGLLLNQHLVDTLGGLVELIV